MTIHQCVDVDEVHSLPEFTQVNECRCHYGCGGVEHLVLNSAHITVARTSVNAVPLLLLHDGPHLFDEAMDVLGHGVGHHRVQDLAQMLVLWPTAAACPATEPAIAPTCANVRASGLDRSGCRCQDVTLQILTFRGLGF